MTDLPEFVLDRTFRAPRDLVWRAWTEPELLVRWYGPGANTELLEHDLSVGGISRHVMHVGGGKHYGKFVFDAVDPPSKLVWRQTSTDADGTDILPPMGNNWPREMLTVVTFEEAGDETNVRLVWSPYNCPPEEVACFRAAIGGMGRGWLSGYEILDTVLSELAAE